MHSRHVAPALALFAGAPALAGDPPVQQERLLWAVDLNDTFAGRWTAVSDDGTIYATSSTTLFAVNPDSSARWMLPDAGAGENIDIGPDGTIYTGGPGTIPTDDLVAVNPDGSLRWREPFPSIIIAGPSVGPDGNIYGAVNQLTTTYGAFSFTPDGQQRWTNPGNPTVESSNDNWPVAFAGGRAAMGIITSATSGSVIWAFTLAGAQEWFGRDLPHDVYGKPVAHPQGFFLSRSHASGIEATAPDGSVVWQSSAPVQGFSGMPPAVGPEGTIYAMGNFGDLWALNPDGSTKYYSPFSGGFYQSISVTPDGSTVLAGGNDIGSTGYVQAFDATDGTPLWQVNIPHQNGTNVFVYSARFTFSPDGRTAYFTTRVGGDLGLARLQAIRIGEPCHANCDGSTTAPILNVADFSCFLTKFASGDPYANCDQSTQEPVLNVADFSCFLTKFAAGCP